MSVTAGASQRVFLASMHPVCDHRGVLCTPTLHPPISSILGRSGVRLRISHPQTIFGNPGHCTRRSVMPAGAAQSRHALLGDTVKPRETGQILVKEAEKALEMPAKHCLWGTCSSDTE